MHKYLELEVLYVGKAYGEDGNRTAPDRLENHSTLQRIQADMIANSPDKDIWLVLWSLDSRLIAVIDGATDKVKATEQEDDAHANLISQKISEEFETSLAEAALVRYFQPTYNKQFKSTFPHKKHLSYAQGYEWDLNSVIVELGADELTLWSTAAPATPHHIAQYPLHSEADRKALFDFT